MDSLLSSVIPGRFKVDVIVQGDKTDGLDYHLSESGIYAIEVDGIISGSIIISTGGIGRKLSHGDIKVAITQSISFKDPAVTLDLCRHESTVLGEGCIEGSAKIPFFINLKKFEEENEIETHALKYGSARRKVKPINTDKKPNDASNRLMLKRYWFNSYDGSTFSINHKIHVIVTRPWYAYSVEKFAPVNLIRITPSNNAIIQRNPVTLIVPDCGGKCILELPSRWVPIGGYANCTVTLQKLKRPITSIYVLLIKAEFIEDQSYDKVIFVHRLFGHGQMDDVPEDAYFFEGFHSRVDESDDDTQYDDPVIKGAQFEFDVMIPGTPFVDDDFVKYDTEGSIVSGGSSACVDKMSDDGGNAHPPSIVSSLSSQAPPLQPTKKTQKRRTSWSSYLNKNNRVNPKYVEQALRLQNPSAATLHSGSPRGASTPSVGSGGQGSSKDSGIDENEPDPNPVIIPSFDSCIRGLHFSRVEGYRELDIDLIPESDSDLDMGSEELDLDACDRKQTLDEPKLESTSSDKTVDKHRTSRDSSSGFRVQGFEDAQRTMARMNDMFADDLEGKFSDDTVRTPRGRFQRSNSTRSSRSNTATTNILRQAQSQEERANLIRDTVAVRYFMRMVVQDAFEKICWNTTELLLYQTDPSSVSPRDIDSSANPIATANSKQQSKS